MLEDGSTANLLRQGFPGGKGRGGKGEGMPDGCRRVSLDLEDLSGALQRVPEKKLAALRGAEEIGDGREGRVPDPLK